ncbi:hypothetical protein ANO11243_050890 [Dothideomycetidae sp. 11243]|nr:hypothetical protein ANO11243_050890 [fungal sp. No.11243]
MSVTTTVVTYVLLAVDTQISHTGSVINADATATSLFIGCSSGFTGFCTHNYTLIFGPWAQPTPPPDASTGVYEYLQTIPAWTTEGSSTITNGEMSTYNVYCDLTSTTLAAKCTTTDINDVAYYGTQSYPQIETFTDPLINGIFAPRLVPITITAGYEKLASLTSSGTAPTASSSSLASSTATSIATSSGPSGNTGSVTSSSSSHASTGAASHLYPINVGTLGLFGLVVAFLTR